YGVAELLLGRIKYFLDLSSIDVADILEFGRRGQDAQFVVVLGHQVAQVRGIEVGVREVDCAQAEGRLQVEIVSDHAELQVEVDYAGLTILAQIAGNVGDDGGGADSAGRAEDGNHLTGGGGDRFRLMLQKNALHGGWQVGAPALGIEEVGSPEPVRGAYQL